MNSTSGANVSLILVSESQLRLFKLSAMCINIVFAVVGGGGNVLMAAAVFRHPQLRSNSSLLLAVLAVFDAATLFINGVNGLFYAAQLLFGLPDMHIRLCFFAVHGPTMFFIFCSTVLVFAVTMDRVLMLKAPHAYVAFREGAYVGGWAAGAVVFSGVSVVAMHYNLYDNFILLHICEGGFLFDPALNEFFLALHMPLSFAIVGINFYSIYAVKEVLIGNSTASVHRREKFQQSLLIVVRIYVIFWITLMILHSVQMGLAPLASYEPVYPLHLFKHCIVLVCVCTCASSNFFIYYSRNSEYRRVFREILHLAPEEVGTGESVFYRRSTGPISLSMPTQKY